MILNKHKRNSEFLIMLLMLLLLTSLLPAIISCTAPERLEKVLFMEHDSLRNATSSELKILQIIRKGRVISTTLGLNLKDGDIIQNSNKSIAIIRLRETEVILRPNTRIEISSHKILNHFGKVFVKTKRLFSVEAKYVIAGVAGTEFLVSTDFQNQVSVVVLNGRIRLESKTRTWEPSLLENNQAVTIYGNAPPRIKSSQKEIDEIRKWVSEINLVLRKDKYRKKRGFFKPLHLNYYESIVASNLKVLKNMQEKYKFSNGSYTDNLKDLILSPPEGMDFEIFIVDNKYFKIMCTHHKTPGYVWMIDTNGIIERIEE